MGVKADLEAWLDLFFRRRRTFVRAAGWTAAIATTAIMLCPPFFTSRAEVLVGQDREQLLVSPMLQEAQGLQLPSINTPIEDQDLNSEVELLTSSYLIERALDGLQPARESAAQRLLELVSATIDLPSTLYDAIHSDPQATPQQRWANKLARHLQCKVIKRSNVIELIFTSHNPKWSQEFLQRLIDRYLEVHAAISHDPEAQRFFTEQSALLKAKLTQSEEKLRAYQLQTGISNFEVQQRALVDEMSSSRSEYRREQAQLAGDEQRVDFLTHQLASYPEQINSETKIVQNYALQTIKPQVLKLEAERAELLTRYRPDSERVKEIDAKLNIARAVLQRENTRDVQEQRNSINPTWLRLSTELAETRATAASLQASEVQLAGQITEYQRQLKDLANAGVDLDRLRQQIDSDREVYLSYVRKGEEARAAEALNLNKILNVSVATRPTRPLKPVFPKAPVDLAAGLFIAAVLGLAASYWTDMQDQRIFSAQTVAAVAGLRTVAILGIAGRG